MDNISQSTPAHQLVTKETAPLINKPRRGGILVGCEKFRFVFVLLRKFSIAMFFLLIFLQLLAKMVCTTRAEVEDGVHRRPLPVIREAEKSSQK